ncbi:MAG: hypothetical protein AAF903_04730 [Pseudomonadota bacterium]
MDNTSDDPNSLLLESAIEELKKLPEEQQQEVEAFIYSKRDEIAGELALTAEMEKAADEGEVEIAAGHGISFEEHMAEIERDIADLTLQIENAV